MSITKTTKHTAAADPVDLLTTARAVEADRAQRVADAQDALDDLLLRRSAGDDSVTSAEVRAAADEVEHWTELHTAAVGKVRQAERSQPNTDTSLASAVAPLIAAARPVPVPVTVTATPPTSPPNADELPMIVVWQKAPSTADLAAGTLSGDLTVQHYRSALHLPLRTDELSVALAAKGTRATVTGGSTSTSAGTQVETFKVTITEAHEYLPLISNTSPTQRHLDGAGWLVQDVVQAHYAVLQDMTTVAPRALSGGSLAGVRASSGFRKAHPVKVATGHPVKVADETSADGQRHVTVRVDAAARITQGTHHELHAELPRLLKDLIGSTAAGLGRVVTAEVVSTVAPETERGLDAVIRLVLTSKLDGQRPTGTNSPRATAKAKVPAARRSARPDPTDVDSHGRTPGSHPGARK